MCVGCCSCVFSCCTHVCAPPKKECTRTERSLYYTHPYEHTHITPHFACLVVTHVQQHTTTYDVVIRGNTINISTRILTHTTAPQLAIHRYDYTCCVTTNFERTVRHSNEHSWYESKQHTGSFAFVLCCFGCVLCVFAEFLCFSVRVCVICLFCCCCFCSLRVSCLLFVVWVMECVV